MFFIWVTDRQVLLSELDRARRAEPNSLLAAHVCHEQC
jgi:hypothetical protein